MNECDDLRFTSDGETNRLLLYQGFNTINITVEDDGCSFFYETIFKRLLGNRFRFHSIFPADGKINVKARFEELGTATNGIPNIYLVDGDFDRYIEPEKMIKNNHFIYLKTYNIENYLIDEAACIETIKCDMRKLDKEIHDIIKFDDWKNKIVSQATPLFLAYCFLKKNYPTVKNVSRSSFLFLDSKTGFRREDNKYHDFYNEIIKSYPEAKDEIKEIQATYEKINGNNYFNLICGKFLLDSLRTYIYNFTKKTIPADTFKYNLATRFDVKTLNYIKNQIEQICLSNNIESTV